MAMATNNSIKPSVAKATSKRRSCKSKVAKRKEKPTRVVGFSEVEVRLYPITLGHNPGGVEGPPLSLSWEYSNIGQATVDDFERHRVREKYQRRSVRDLWISPRRRAMLLREAGFSDEEIDQAANVASEQREQRRTSLKDMVLRLKAAKLKRQQQAALQDLSAQLI